MGNKSVADEYLLWVSSNWDSLRKKYFTFCKEKNYTWSDDIFSDTYLKIYEKILKSGINDHSEEGFDNYTSSHLSKIFKGKASIVAMQNETQI